MARNDSATAEAASIDGANGAGASTGATNPNARVNIVVPMPKFMREQIEGMAGNAATGPYVRDLLAKQLGIDLPATVRTKRSKYNSPEEKEAAQKAKAKQRNELIKQLLAEHKARQNEDESAGTSAESAPAEAQPA